MKKSSATIIGNLTVEPQIKQLGNSNACVFSMAVSTGEKDTATNEYITNFYEVTWFGAPTVLDNFISKAQKGTEVVAFGNAWMYSYYSKKDECTKSGLKMRANDVTPLARLKGEAPAASAKAAPAKTAARKAAPAEDDFDL